MKLCHISYAQQHSVCLPMTRLSNWFECLSDAGQQCFHLLGGQMFFAVRPLTTVLAHEANK